MAATEDVAQYNGTNNIVQVGYGVEVLFLQFTRESVESRDAFVVLRLTPLKCMLAGRCSKRGAAIGRLSRVTSCSG